MNKTEITSLIDWFKTADFNNPHIWTRDPVGQIIRNNLEILGRWKKLPRGNPRKAFGEMRKTQAKNNGFEPPDEEIDNDWP